MTNENKSVTETVNPATPEVGGTQSDLKSAAVTTENPQSDFLQTSPEAKKAGLSTEEKMSAMFGYLPFTVFVPLALHKDSEFCQAHGRQAVILSAFAGILFLITVLMGGVWAYALLHMGASFYGMFSASVGKPANMPVLSDMAKKIKL